nr:reverse transcriptase domain-containing protein [Tanacetum cinerariifolium]
MSKLVERAPTPVDSIILNTTRKGRKQKTDGPPDFMPDKKLCELCDKHYNQILPLMAEKVHQEKLQGMQTRLTYGESSQRNSQTQEKTQLFESESCDKKKRSKKEKAQCKHHVQSVSGSPEPKRGRSESPRKRDSKRKMVFKRLENGVFHRLGDKENGTKPAFKKHHNKRASSRMTEAFSESEDNIGGHWKTRSKKQRSSIEDDDLAQPWVCEETDPFTPRIRYFDLQKMTRMPSHLKTYDRSEDLEDHLKIFQAAAKVKRWAMPTWCHMFNSTLTGSAKVWFDDLPPEFVDNYDDLKEAFLENFLQHKKCIKDPMEIHHIKQREGKSTKDFVHGFKIKSMDVKGAPKVMRISGFMQGITNPELIKHLHDKISRSVDDMMRVTTSFLGAVSGPKGQPSASNQSIEERIKVAINPEHPEQTIIIGSTLTEEGRNRLCDLLPRNLDVFAWKHADMTGVPRHVLEHLNMPFGPRNARATYQRLVDKAFHKQIGKNLEGNQHEAEPQKCTFRVEEEMFLGYKVNTKGIKVCPNKADAVLSLPSPKCLKDVQKLNGKLASLNRFLAKSAKKSLPFFKNLKKYTKKSDFHWIKEAESAFKQMKQLIAKLPMLTAPAKKEELIVYLAAAKEAVSAVLMTEREAKQMPIYFVSRALRGPEVNYTSMEKLVLALVYASKRLKRFEVTNNEGEYEALIAGLRIAKQMGAKNLHENIDSRLVANQVNGTYIAKEADMIQYLEKVKALTNGFKMFSIKQVPRNKNKKADALSKIASTSFAHLSKQVLVKELKEKSIDEVYRPVPRNPHQKLVPITSPWLFYKWGIDIAGPFPKGHGKVKFLIVAIDYFTKWIEEKPVATITGNQVKKFVWDNIVCRFRLTREIIFDNGKQFRDNPFKDWCEKLFISAKIGVHILRTTEVDMVQNDEALEINLDLLEERREQATIREAKSKAKMEKYYNQRSAIQASRQETSCTIAMMQAMRMKEGS